MIRKIAGKNQSSNIKHLIKNNDEVTNIKDIANTLAETFSPNSSSDNTNTEFHNYKSKTEKQKLNFISDNTKNYNGFFTLQVLKETIQTSHNVAAGLHKIHYEFLKQLPPKSLDYLLNTFNYIWKNSSIPESWKLATIIPIPKPRKNNLYPKNYRPIALTSCLCKTMKCMVNKRLVWYIESNNLFTNSQCGFRNQRSTMDHVVRLETSIKEANIQKPCSHFFRLGKGMRPLGDMVSWKTNVTWDWKADIQTS